MENTFIKNNNSKRNPTSEEKKAAYKAWGKKCFICGIDNNKKNLNLHHIVPRSLGGSNSYRNLMPLCQKCHDFVHLLYDFYIKNIKKSENEITYREFFSICSYLKNNKKYLNFLNTMINKFEPLTEDIFK